MIESKMCEYCFRVKPLSRFGTTRNAYRHKCNDCRNLAIQIRYENDPDLRERRAAQKREWRRRQQRA